MNRRPITILTDTIQPLHRDDYRADRALMLQTLVDCGTQAVHEIGSVSAPGISDLDLLAVFADDADLAACTPAVNAALAGTRRCFLHPPWAIHQGQLALLPSLWATQAMPDLMGGPPLAATQTPLQRQFWNVEAAPSVLAVLTSRRRITTRSMLCLLNGVRYNVALAAQDGIAVADPDDFATRIVALRQNWFELPQQAREAEAIHLWHAGTNLLQTLVQAQATALAALLEGEPGELLLPVPGTRTHYLFAEQPQPRQFLPNPFTNLLPLPQTLGAVFAGLAEGPDSLQPWLAPQRLHTSPAWCFRPAAATALAGYAHDNARYLRDHLRTPHPFLLLGGGTLVHVRNTRATRLKGLLRRVARRLVPV